MISLLHLHLDGCADGAGQLFLSLAYSTMAKKTTEISFDEVLALLAGQKFDVAAAHEGSQRRSGAVRVCKYGCAAEISGGNGGPTVIIARPGWILGGEITRLVDKGYQKFLKNSRIEIPATAEILRAIHDFSRELDAATGQIDLYNDALGTTSDVYLYDRVAGRPDSGH